MDVAVLGGQQVQFIIVPADGHGIQRQNYAHAALRQEKMMTARTRNHMGHVHTHPHQHTNVTYKQTIRQVMNAIASEMLQKCKMPTKGNNVMKTFILIFVSLTITSQIAYAACTANTKVYTSCKTGRYLENAVCKPCPAGTYGGGGTSASCSPCPTHNSVSGSSSSGSTSETDCYISSGSSWSFSVPNIGSGNEHFNSTCYYSN